MKFLPFCLAASTLALASSGCAAQPSAAVFPPPAACTAIVLTGHPDYPPVAWADGSTLQGGAIDVMRRITRNHGIALTVVNEGSWDGAQMAVRKGRADAIVGLYRTQQRLAYFRYVSPPMAPDPSSVLIPAGEPFHYAGWDSLIGKRGVVGAGESYGSKFDAFLHAKLTTYRVNGLPAIYQQLRAGKAQYGLSGYYAALTSLPKGISIAVPDFVTEGLYLAFGKNDRCGARLAPAFSRDIGRLAADGTIATIFKRALAEYEKTH